MFNWTRNPVEARRLARRREELLGELLGGRKPLVPPGVEQLMDLLQRHQVGGARCGCGRALWQQQQRSWL